MEYTSQAYADFLKAEFSLNHAFLSEPITVIDNGVRRTFLPPGNARGCESHAKPVNWVNTLKSRGARRLQQNELWWQEAYVYARERQRIVAELLSGLEKAPMLPRDEEHSPHDTTPFIEDFGKALKRQFAKKIPKVIGKSKLQIKNIDDHWWLFHRQWTPLCFESFEEAVAFANRYILKRIQSQDVA